MRQEDGTTGVPSHFYKYRSLAGEQGSWIERTLLHDEIYFAPASSFNDPFDLRPAFSLEASTERQREDFIRLSRKFEPEMPEEERQLWADRVMKTSLAPENLQSTTNGIQAVHNFFITSQVGVYCVSELCDDILMWSHYADSHRGICLEFDGHGPLMAHAQCVTYSKDRVPLNVYDDDKLTGVDKALLTKSDRWCYENEWRLIRHDKGPGVVKFRPENLTGIIVGSLASPETVGLVRSWAKRRRLSLDLRRAVTSRSKFELEIVPLRL